MLKIVGQEYHRASIRRDVDRTHGAWPARDLRDAPRARIDAKEMRLASSDAAEVQRAGNPLQVGRHVVEIRSEVHRWPSGCGRRDQLCGLLFIRRAEEGDGFSVGGPA